MTNGALLCTNPDSTVDLRKLFTELKRHNFYPSTVIHAMPSWRLLIQIASRGLAAFRQSEPGGTLGDEASRSGNRTLPSLS